MELVLQFIQERFFTLVDVIIFYAPKFFWAFLVLILFYFLTRFSAKYSYRLMERSPFDNTLNSLTSALVGVVVFLIGLVIIFNILGWDRTVVSLLAGAGIIGIALAFAFQDSAANLLAGVILAFRRPFRVTHLIKFAEFEGRVKSIGLRTTKLEIPSGETAEIPNRMIIENPLINYTLMGKRRVDFEVGVSYAEDLKKVKKVTEKALSKVKDVQGIELFYREFGDSSIVLMIRIWIPFNNANKDYHKARDDAIIRIKEAYDKAGIQIPWPIRTLDFGIKGGEKLKSHLN